MSAAQLGKEPFGFVSVSHGCTALGSPHQGWGSTEPQLVPPISEHPPSLHRPGSPGTALGPGELLQGSSSREQALAPQLPAFL